MDDKIETLGYDGCHGINDHGDEYHPRIATFTPSIKEDRERMHRLGRLFEKAPQLRKCAELLEELLISDQITGDAQRYEATEALRAAGFDVEEMEAPEEEEDYSLTLPICAEGDGKERCVHGPNGHPGCYSDVEDPPVELLVHKAKPSDPEGE